MDTNEINTDETETQYTGTASYCMEDNKLRLYIGRVPRDEYLALRAEGWVALHKQREAGQGDFAAVWTPTRRNTALRYADEILSEDDGPEERAADRAERFEGYLGKRLDEAGAHADKYEAEPSAHGYQDKGRAVRAADRHDKKAGRAVDAWEKAEYWQRRTAGVISHRLHLSSPGVRMGRIKTLEAEQRKCLAGLAEYAALWSDMKKLDAIEGEEEKTQAVRSYLGGRHVWADYMHPSAETLLREWDRTNKKSLWSLLSMPNPSECITGAEALALFFSNHGEPKSETEWTRHYKNRLAYENAMLEAQGGRAAMLEMEVGGWIGNHQIRKVNKSNATGRVVSVTLKIMGNRWGNEAKPGEFYVKPFNVERLPVGAYRAPSAEDKAAFEEVKKAEKAAAPKYDCPLVNPTDEDAQRLQDIWNEAAADSGWYQRNDGKPSEVLHMTQAAYSAVSGGTYSRAETVVVCETGLKHERRGGEFITRSDVFKVRATSNGYNADRVIVISDKPQKALPWAKLEAARKLQPTIASLIPKMAEIDAALSRKNGSWVPAPGTPERALIEDARYCGLAFVSSMSQFGWTEKGMELLKAQAAAPGPQKTPSGAFDLPCSVEVRDGVPESIRAAMETAPRVQTELFA